METNHTPQQERAILVGVSLPTMPAWEAEHSLDELGRLAATAGLVEAERQIQGRDRIDPDLLRRQGQGRLPQAACSPSAKPM